MTVKELIAQLKKLPPDLDVMMGDFTSVDKVVVETFDEVPGYGPEAVVREKVVFIC